MNIDERLKELVTESQMEPWIQSGIGAKAPALVAALLRARKALRAEHDAFWDGEHHKCTDDGGPYIASCKTLADKELEEALG